MLNLKHQYFGHLMQRAELLAKTLMLGKTEGKRRRGQQRMRWLDSITDSVDMNWANSGRQWRTGKPGMLHAVHGVTESDANEWLNNDKGKRRWGGWNEKEANAKCFAMLHLIQPSQPPGQVGVIIPFYNQRNWGWVIKVYVHGQLVDDLGVKPRSVCRQQSSHPWGLGEEERDIRPLLLERKETYVTCR